MEMMGVLSMSRAGGGLGNPTNGRPPNGNPYPHQQQITHPYPHQAQSSPHRPLGAPYVQNSLARPEAYNPPQTADIGSRTVSVSPYGDRSTEIGVC